MAGKKILCLELLRDGGRGGGWADVCRLSIALCLCYSWLIQTIVETIEWLQIKLSLNTAVSGFYRNAHM